MTIVKELGTGENRKRDLLYTHLIGWKSHGLARSKVSCSVTQLADETRTQNVLGQCLGYTLESMNNRPKGNLRASKVRGYGQIIPSGLKTAGNRHSPEAWGSQSYLKESISARGRLWTCGPLKVELKNIFKHDSAWAIWHQLKGFPT